MSQTGVFVAFSIWYRFLALPGAYVKALEPGHATTWYRMSRAGLGTGLQYRLLLQPVLMPPINTGCNNS